MRDTPGTAHPVPFLRFFRRQVALSVRFAPRVSFRRRYVVLECCARWCLGDLCGISAGSVVRVHSRRSAIPHNPTTGAAAHRPEGACDVLNQGEESATSLSAETTAALRDIGLRLRALRRVLFITGAGISADSGLPTYRGVGGLYNDEATEDGMAIEEALSGACFAARPDIT